MNKKAIAVGRLVGIILALVAFLLIAVTVSNFMSKTEDKEVGLLCHTSVALRAASTFNIGEADIKLSPLLCKTTDQKIVGNREEIKEQLARSMARCWWMFNEARQDDALDELDDIWEVVGFAGNDNKCFLCYNMMIDQEEIEGGPIGAQEMTNYLLETDHYQINGLKYYDYIQSYGGPGTIAVMENIYPEYAYGITFLSKSNDEAAWTWVDTLAVSGIIAAAAVVGVTCVISVGVTCAVAAVVGVGIEVGGKAYLVSHAYNAWIEEKAKFYGIERPISMVVLDDLRAVEAGKCAINDLAGE